MLHFIFTPSRQWVLLLIFTTFSGFADEAGKTTSLTYFGASGKYAFKNDYFLSLLDSALNQGADNDNSYRLQQFPTRMNQSRAIEEMAENCSFDIQWHMTTTARETALLPVRIPLFKGLQGYRALMIHQASAAKFNELSNEAELQLLLAGQGADWPDTRILEHNQYAVQGVNNYHALFDMLAKQRIDYFPRSVTEIGEELALHSDKPLQRESGTLLHYPAPIYFFVCPKHEQLAQRLSDGLLQMHKDGRFDVIFEASQEYQRFMESGGFDGKQVYQLQNPLLNEATLPKEDWLWLRP